MTLLRTSAVILSSLLAWSCAATHGRFDPSDSGMPDAGPDAHVGDTCRSASSGDHVLMTHLPEGDYVGQVLERTPTQLAIQLSEDQELRIAYVSEEGPTVGTGVSIHRARDGFTTLSFNDQWYFAVYTDSAFSAPSEDSFPIPRTGVTVRRTEACVYDSTCMGRRAGAQVFGASASIGGETIDLRAGESTPASRECTRGELRFVGGSQLPGCSSTDESTGFMSAIEGRYEYSFLYTCLSDEVFAGDHGGGAAHP